MRLTSSWKTATAEAANMAINASGSSTAPTPMSAKANDTPNTPKVKRRNM